MTSTQFNESVTGEGGTDAPTLGKEDIDATNEYQSLGLLALIGFALLTCVAGLGDGPRMGDHECIVAQSARQAIQTGEWLIPRVGEIPRVRKTPLGIWLSAAAAQLFDDPNAPPVTDYSARFPSAVGGVLTCLAIYWLGRMMYGHRAGLVAGFIAAGSVGTILYARDAKAEMVLTLFTTLSIACFWRGAIYQPTARWAMVLFYVCFGLAMMAKAPLPLATVGLPLACFWFVAPPLVRRSERTHATSQERQHGGDAGQPVWRYLASEARDGLRRLRSLWIIPGVVLFVVVAGAWPAYVFLKVPNALHLWWMEYMDRFSGDLGERPEPFFFYIPVLFVMTIPFMLSLPEALAATFLKRYRDKRPGLAYAFTWAIIGTLFLSAASFKRSHYIASILPAYSLLLAPVIDRLFFGMLVASRKRVRMVCALLSALFCIAAIVGGVLLRREVPSLLPVYVLIAALALVIWTSACISFARQRRLSAFAQLNLGTLVVLLLGWPAAGAHLRPDVEAHALAAQLREHHIRPEDEIYLVVGRPNSAIEFYSGLRIRRLIDELEMADLRSNRRDIDEELMREAQRRIEKMLSGAKPVYLILKIGHYGLLRQHSDLHARTVFELHGHERNAGDELTVITQSWNTVMQDQKRFSTGRS